MFGKTDDASKLPHKMMGGVRLRFLYCVAKSSHCTVLSVLTHKFIQIYVDKHIIVY